MKHTVPSAARRVMVVGGTSGIGRGIAEAFSAAGCNVIATGATAAEVAAATRGSESTNIVFLPLDVRSDEAVEAHFGALEQLHVLVNCAGIIKRGEEHDPKVFAQVLDVNLNGTMRTCSAARGLLKASAAALSTPPPCSASLVGAWCPATAPARELWRNSPSRWPSPTRPTAFGSMLWRPAGSPHR